jgi:subtilase family serine protease
MKRRHVAAGAVALTTAIAMAGAGAGMAHAAGQGNDNVRLSNSGRSTLSNSGVRTLGAASTSTKLDLSIAVPLRNQALMNSMLAKGTVISPAQYKNLFGASPASLAKVSKWAKSQGMTVVSTDAASGSVNVQAPVSHVNKAFSLKMQRVALGARTGLAPSADPQLPRDLGVSSIVGLNTVSTASTGPVNKLSPVSAKKSGGPQSDRSSVRTGGKLGTIGTAAAGSPNCSNYWGENLYPSAKYFTNESNAMCGYSPQQTVKLYNASKASTAKAKVGILLWCNDKNVVAKTNHLSDHFKYPRLTSYDNQSAPEDPKTCADGDAYGEQDLDVQTSHIISPKASISYYGAASNSFADLLSMFQKAVKQHKVSTLSMSWSAPESQTPTSFVQQFERTAQQASLTGISLFGSSGDMGDESIKDNGTKPSGSKDVAYPASSPYFTSVGGTAVGTKKDGSRLFTAGWSTTWWAQPNPASTSGIKQYPFPHNGVGAGGGVSTKFAQPTWQKGKVKGSTTKRAVPDVSANADIATPIAVEFDQGEITGSGGTSQSSPLVASLVASSKALTGRKIGNAAPYFYKLGSADILDVKAIKAGTYGAMLGQDQKTNDLVLEGIAQPADSLRVQTGWDNVTGLGEPTGSFLTDFGK